MVICQKLSKIDSEVPWNIITNDSYCSPDAPIRRWSGFKLKICLYILTLCFLTFLKYVEWFVQLLANFRSILCCTHLPLYFHQQLYKIKFLNLNKSSMFPTIIDSQLSLLSHVAALCRFGFYHLRQLRPLCRSLTHRSYKDTSPGVHCMSPGLLQLFAVQSDSCGK